MTANDAPDSIAHPAALPPPPPPRRAEDALLASLGRRFRGATLTLDFELRTATARRIFQRDFVYVSQQLHALEASRRVQGLDRQVLKDALDAVGLRAQAVRDTLLRCASDARALVAQHGHAASDVAFARPTRLKATIVSPYARDFLDILGQADDALIQLEKAWLLGLLDPAAKSQRGSDCRRALQGFKELVRQQRHVVGLHVRAVNAARREAVGRIDTAPSPVDSGTLALPGDRVRTSPRTGADEVSLESREGNSVPASSAANDETADSAVAALTALTAIPDIADVAAGALVPVDAAAATAVGAVGDAGAAGIPGVHDPSPPSATAGIHATIIGTDPGLAAATRLPAPLRPPAGQPRGAMAEALAAALAGARVNTAGTTNIVSIARNERNERVDVAHASTPGRQAPSAPAAADRRSPSDA